MKHEIKENWIKLELNELIEVSKEKFDPSKNKWTQCVELEHISQGTGLLFGTVNSDEQKSIKNKFKKGDVLFGKLRPYLKKYWKAKFDGVCSTEIWVLRGRKISNNYLYYLIQTQKFTKISNISSGSKMPRSDWNYMKGIPFEVPKLNFEQQKIAEILSTWDKAIELKEKLIEEKKEFKRGLMQKLLVGKLRFKEHVKNPNLQEAKRYSTLPEEWSIKKASSIFSKISKKNNRNEQLLSATQNNGVIPRDLLDGDVMSHSGDTKSYKLVEEGDFVISLRSFQGGIEYSSYRGIISPAYTVIKNKIPICKDFYRYIFKSKLFIDRLASSVIGIRDGKQISYGDFSFMFLPYPELKEQEKIAFTLKNLDYNIELLELELSQFKEQKRGLMQLLLTGIVRVEVD